MNRRRAKTKVYLLVLGLICLAALGLRAWVCAELRQHPFVIAPPKATDMATYQTAARQILAGQWPQSFYHLPFYYAVFLPLVYLVLTPEPLAVMAVQSILGAMTVWLTGLIAARLFGRLAGLAAALLLAISRFHIFYTPFVLIAVLQTFLLTLFVWMALQAWHRRTVLWWAGTGLAGSVAVLSRGSVLLLMPGFFALLLWRERRNPVRAMILACVAAACLYVPQLPFSIVNCRATGRWTGPSTALDAVLALGNTPESPPGIPGATYYPPTYHQWMHQAAQAGPSRVPVSRNVLHWIRQEPFAWLELKVQSMLLYWNYREIPNNIYIGQFEKDSRVLSSALLVDFGVIGSLGIAGMLVWAWRSRKSPAKLFLYWIVFSYWLVTALFYILARFRIPALPFICVFAGAYIEFALRVRRDAGWARRLRRLATGAFALLVGSLVVLAGFDFYKNQVEAVAVQLARPCGVLAEDESAWLLYDHGPQLLGGWGSLPVERGLLVKKEFCVPPRLASFSARPAASGIRLAILAPAGGDLEVEGRGPQAQQFHIKQTLPSSDAVQWLAVRFPAPVPLPPPGGRVAITMNCRPLDARPCFLVADQCRYYGRTEVAGTESESAIMPLGAELCAQLELSPGE
jgi:4-amino-4-deoxy-L-arabinose transferase-like glycosyltransferase